VQTQWREKGLSKGMEVRIFSYWFQFIGFRQTEVYDGFQSLWCKITENNARGGNKSVHEMVKNVHIDRYLQTKAEEGSGKPSSASI
jgi:hypothetical protein